MTPNSASTQPSAQDSQHAFLMRQVGRILTRGGSNADVATYLQHYQGLPQGAKDSIVMDARDPDMVPPTPSLPVGLSMKALQGLTFGFGDEAIGGLAGLATLVTTGNPIEAERIRKLTTEGFREQEQTFQGAHPVASFGAEIAGGVANPALAAGAASIPAAAGRSLARRLAVSSAAGAAGGAAYGLGNATGPVSDRARSALWGGIAGAILGPPTALAVAGAGKLGEQVVRSSPVRAAIEGIQYWAGKIQQRVATVPQVRAPELAAEALVRDGYDFGTLSNRAEQAIRTGTPTSLVDLVEDNASNTFKLALAAQGQRGNAKQKLADNLMAVRSEEGPRMLADLFRSTRLGTQNAYEAATVLQEQASAQASPLYTQAHQQDVLLSPRLVKLFQEPVMKDAWALAKNTADMQDRLLGPVNGLAVPDLPAELQGARLPIRGLDYAKQKLDEIIERGAEGRPILGRRDAHTLRAALNDALNDVDAQSPAYQAARSLWRGSKEAQDALALGKGGRPLPGQTGTSTRFLNRPPEEIARDLESLGRQPGGDMLRAMYRLGAIQDINDAIYAQTGDATNVAQKIFGGRAYGDTWRSAELRIRALFDDPVAAQDFMERVHGQTIAHMRHMALINRANLRPEAGGPGEQFIGGGQIPVRRGLGMELLSLGAKTAERIRTGMNEDISDEVSLLFTKGLRDPQELRTLLETLRPYLLQAQQGAGRTARTGAIGGQLGEKLTGAFRTP